MNMLLDVDFPTSLFSSSSLSSLCRWVFSYESSSTRVFNWLLQILKNRVVSAGDGLLNLIRNSTTYEKTNGDNISKAKTQFICHPEGTYKIFISLFFICSIVCNLRVNK